MTVQRRRLRRTTQRWLKDKLDESPKDITECDELQQWGRYIRSEKMPGPSQSPKGCSIYNMMGSSRDEDDPVPEGAYDPDLCENVQSIVMGLPHICQCVLFAYYCEWPGSIRKCSKFMIYDNQDDKRRLSEREFSLKVGFAQGLVMGSLRAAA